MKTRATISIRPDVLENAKYLAARSHSSVSALIESLLAEASRHVDDPVSSLIGSASLKETCEPDPLRDHLIRKYLKS